MSTGRAIRDVPYLTAAQMVEVDRVMIEEYGIELIQMMENAGRNLAHLARTRFLDGDPVGKRVVVLAGPGGNGGGVLAAARRLATWGARVQVATSAPPERFTRVPARQLRTLVRLGVPVTAGMAPADSSAPDLLLDGVIGYSLSGAPRGAAADLIRWANARGVPILALDTPSGLDTTSGAAFEPAIRATATMTLALPKEGLRAPAAAAHVGELYLADIGVPPALYAGPGLGLSVGPVFARAEVLRLR